MIVAHAWLNLLLLVGIPGLLWSLVKDWEARR